MRRLIACVTLVLAMNALAAPLAQPAGIPMEQRIASVKAALARSNAVLHSYQWAETTTVFVNGEQKSQTIKNCFYGADGTLQKTVVEAPTQSDSGFGLFSRIREREKDEMQQYMQKAVALVKSYVPPDPVLIQSARDRGAASLQIVDPNSQINVVIPSYIKQQDSMTISLNIATNDLMGISVNTYLDDWVDPGQSPNDPVTMSLDEGRFSDGTQYTQQVTVNAPSRNLKVVVQNSGYVQMSPLPPVAPPPMAAFATPPQQPTAPNYNPSPAAVPPSQFSMDAMDKLTAPIALYPDALVIQILTCAGSPFEVKQVNDFVQQNPGLKGSALQDAASRQGFDSSFVAIVLFPQVLNQMATQMDWTRQLGDAFTNNKAGVFASIQRLRSQAQAMGNLQSNQQQQVQTTTTQSGQQVIVVQPANPQVVYVPQYNPTVVYTQPGPPPPSYSSSDVAAAGLIGFAGGVIVGAAASSDHDSNCYSSGAWGYHAAPLCSAEGYSSYAQNAQAMTNDYYNHQQNMANSYYQNQQAMAAQAGKDEQNRQQATSQNEQNRQQTSTQNQAQRQQTRTTEQQTAGANTAERQSSRQAAGEQMSSSGGSDKSAAASRSYYQNKGSSESGAFSGYQRGSSERESSERGNSSMGGGGWGGGGGSRGGGGGGGGGGGRSWSHSGGRR